MKQRLNRKFIDVVKQCRKQYKDEPVGIVGDAGLADYLDISRQTVGTWRKIGMIPKYCYYQRFDRLTGEPVGHIVYNLNKVLTAIEDRLQDDYGL
jgi:hypothetical protein